MCIDFEYELDYSLKCDICKKKPAVDLREPDTGEPEGDYKALCEACAIQVFGEEIVSDFGGTQLYLKKYPDMADAWPDEWEKLQVESQ